MAALCSSSPPLSRSLGPAMPQERIPEHRAIHLIEGRRSHSDDSRAIRSAEQRLGANDQPGPPGLTDGIERSESGDENHEPALTVRCLEYACGNRGLTDSLFRETSKRRLIERGVPTGMANGIALLATNHTHQTAPPAASGNSIWAPVDAGSRAMPTRCAVRW